MEVDTNKRSNIIFKYKIITIVRDLLEINKDKASLIYSNYFGENSQNDSIKSHWMLPKEKISQLNKIEYFLKEDEVELFKVLLFSK
jgi:hypothetical protein